jgi:hypothetical protein
MEKKRSHTFVALFPKCDIAGIWLTYTLDDVVHAFGTRATTLENVHLVDPPVKESVIV